ncbi:hypothetical protein [Herbiconiux sp. UC225_62]|uniref:hypothetical protein n=1 Tax=Herbiconiux sp. UC225_62 TaxID=3350168 RepID=UPI0036D26363
MTNEEPMRQPSDTPTDEPTFDDLLWELDVTTARPELRETPAPAHPVADEARVAPKTPKAPKAHKRGRFHRPELETGWERISRNRAVQVLGGVVLLGGTAALVVAALSR